MGEIDFESTVRAVTFSVNNRSDVGPGWMLKGSVEGTDNAARPVMAETMRAAGQPTRRQGSPIAIETE